MTHPYEAASLSAASGSPSVSAGTARFHTSVEGAAHPPFWVLVVDDEEAVASVLARGLRYAGYQTETAQSGSEALEKLAVRSFDALLTDISMPKMRGDELQRIARERDPNLAALLITAADDTECAVECLKHGASDYLLKPFEISDVVLRVGKALEKRQMSRDVENYRKSLETQVKQQAGQIKQTVEGSLHALIHALEAKDPNTRNHSARVADLAALLAHKLCPGDIDFASRVRIAALFHDIGKIGVGESILNKKGGLTKAELEKVRKHPEIGAAILSPLLDGEIVEFVRSHHEQVDGGGYPNKLVSNSIPLGGRIVAVADAYDAMTSARPYRSELARHEVLQIIANGAGVHWDYEVVQALLALASAGKLAETLPPRTSIEEVASLAAHLNYQNGRAIKEQELASETAAEADKAASAPHGKKAASPHGLPVLYGCGFVDGEAIAALREGLTTYLRQGQTHIVLDLHEATAITTDNAQSLYALGLLARRSGGSLILRGVPPLIKAVFQSAGLTRLLKME